MQDNWSNRSKGRTCGKCMFYVEKTPVNSDKNAYTLIGRCRRNAPTLAGYPAVYPSDFCGEFKVDENKI